MPAPARQFGVLGRAALWAEASVDPELLFGFPEKSPGTVCRCHPIELATSSTGVLHHRRDRDDAVALARPA